MSNHVLVVDDDVTVRDGLRRALEAEGFVVETARDGVSGIRAAVGDPPIVAILDVSMPDLDGWTVADRLAAAPRTSRTPVVFLSGRPGEVDLGRAQRSGAAAIVTKPYDLADLMSLVHEVVAEGARRR